MIRPEHPFDIRPDLRKAETTKAESTTAESVIRPKQLVRVCISYVIDASRGVPKVITDGTHAPPISVKIVGEPH